MPVTKKFTPTPLFLATVFVTDFLNITQTALTDASGNYTITGIASGAFNGSIIKSGYATYNFNGNQRR